MSYLVFARKYRPQKFEDIVGQEHVTRTLQNAITQDRLHHAFLFTGARGVGKTTAARILAKSLSCEKGPTPTPCNECEACVEITRGSSVDVQEIDAASNNGVDNIRELREAIRYAPVRGKKKVYILDEVHMLSGGAWNALLKTLEEPPPHAVFVFATTDPHKLPATILSRVQRYDFKLVQSRSIMAHLAGVLGQEGMTFDDGALALIARESGGSVRDSLSLLDQVAASVPPGEGLTEKIAADVLGVADRKLLADLGHAVLAHDAGAALRLLDGAFVRGYDLAQLAQALLGYLRDLVVAQTVAEPAGLIEASAAEIAELQAIARGADKGLLEILFQRLARVAQEVARSASPRYVLEMGLIELARAEALQPLGELLGKLEQLEARVESRGGGVGPRGGSEAKSSTGTSASTGTSMSTAQATVASEPARPPIRLAPTDFSGLIEQLIAHDPRLSAMAQSRQVEWTPEKLVLGFDQDFPADGIRERMVILKGALKTLLGKDMTIEIIVGQPVPGSERPNVIPTETLIEVHQRHVDEDRETRRSEALNHPIRKTIDTVFGGAWKEPVVDDVPNSDK